PLKYKLFPTIAGDAGSSNFKYKKYYPTNTSGHAENDSFKIFRCKLVSLHNYKAFYLAPLVLP
ncbi:hypothetical protein ACFL1N_01595, partial [Thermodesulfobacteriota bacterium]